MAAVLAHFLKWPVAVCVLTKHLQALPRPWGAGALFDAFWRGILAADKLTLDEMHAAMSRGRMAAVTGLVVHGQRLGLLEKVDFKFDDSPQAAAAIQDEKPEKQRLDERPQFLCLGKKLQTYRVRVEQFPVVIGMIEGWLSQVRTLLAPEPSLENIDAVAQSILVTISKIRGSLAPAPAVAQDGSLSSAGSGKRARRADPPHGYMAKHFARAVILAMDGAFWHLPCQGITGTMGGITA